MTQDIQRYNRAAVALHWSIAALIAGLLVLGVFLDGLPKGPLRSQLFLLHKSFGLLALVLALFRFYWRTKYEAPAPVPAPASLGKAADYTHAAIYALAVLVPFVALGASSVGRGIDFFFLHAAPPFGVNQPLSQYLMAVHARAAYLLAALVGLHVAAALWHQYYRQDRILERMKF